MKIIVRNPNDDTNAKFKLKALTDGVIAVNTLAGAIIKNEDNEWLTCLSGRSALISCAGASNKLFIPFDFDAHIADRPAGLESFWDWSMNGGYGDTPYGGWEAVFNSMREDDKIVDWDIYVDEIKIGTTHIVPLSRLNESDPGYDENEMDLWFNEILSTVKGLGIYYPDAINPNEINADIETFFKGIVQTDGIDVVMPHKTIRALYGLVLVNKTNKPMRIKFVPSNPLVTMGNRWKAGFGIRPHSLTENYAYLLDLQPLAETMRGNDAITVDTVDGSINICLNPAPKIVLPIECVASPEEEFYYNLDSSYSDKTLALGYKLDDEENGITTGKVLSSTNDFADPSNLFYDLAGITGWKLSGGSIEPDELCVGGNKSLTAWIEVANLGSYDSNTYGAPKLDYVIDGVPGTITYSGGYVYKNAANHNNATEARAYYRELYQQFADGLTALGFVVEIHDGTLFRTVNIGNYFSYMLKVTFSSGQFGTVSMGGNNIETGGNGPRWNPASFDYTCTVNKTPYNSPNEFGYRLGGYDGRNAYHFMPGGIVLTIDTCANLGITLDEGEVDMFTSLSRAEPIVITSCGAEQGG